MHWDGSASVPSGTSRIVYKSRPATKPRKSFDDAAPDPDTSTDIGADRAERARTGLTLTLRFHAASVYPMAPSPPAAPHLHRSRRERRRVRQSVLEAEPGGCDADRHGNHQRRRDDATRAHRQPRNVRLAAVGSAPKNAPMARQMRSVEQLCPRRSTSCTPSRKGGPFRGTGR